MLKTKNDNSCDCQKGDVRIERRETCKLEELKPDITVVVKGLQDKGYEAAGVTKDKDLEVNCSQMLVYTCESSDGRGQLNNIRSVGHCGDALMLFAAHNILEKLIETHPGEVMAMIANLLGFGTFGSGDKKVSNSPEQLIN